MPDPRALDQDIRRISRMAARILGLISTVDQVPRPALYQHVMRGVAEMQDLWAAHLDVLAGVLVAILDEDTGQALLCREIKEKAVFIGSRLEALSAAGWPRDSRIGITSIHVRVREILGTILKFLETERSTVLPFLEQAPPESAKRAATGL